MGPIWINHCAGTFKSGEKYGNIFFGGGGWHAGSQFPHQGSNPCPLQWKRRVLTTGPPGKSQKYGNILINITAEHQPWGWRIMCVFSYMSKIFLAGDAGSLTVEN